MCFLHIVLLHRFTSLGRWISDEWEHCPRTCGSLGFQIRTVRCVQFLHDGTNRSVHSKYCSGEKPESRRACNRVPCPAPWRTGAWSEVRTAAYPLFSRSEFISNGKILLKLQVLEAKVVGKYRPMTVNVGGGDSVILYFT